MYSNSMHHYGKMHNRHLVLKSKIVLFNIYGGKDISILGKKSYFLLSLAQRVVKWVQFIIQQRTGIIEENIWQKIYLYSMLF